MVRREIRNYLLGILNVQRCKLMNNRYDEIKNESFDYVDLFFHIHGSHRNRK